MLSIVTGHDDPLGDWLAGTSPLATSATGSIN
jgi:hypothetical protein